MLSAARRALTEKCYIVVAVTSKEDYSRALVENPFDLVILDIELPGIAIRNLIEEARASNPKTRFLYLSSSRSMQAQSDFFLKKPFLLDDLNTLVRKVLDRPDIE